VGEKDLLYVLAFVEKNHKEENLFLMTIFFQCQSTGNYFLNASKQMLYRQLCCAIFLSTC
jgi:hypothetical protein